MRTDILRAARFYLWQCEQFLFLSFHLSAVVYVHQAIKLVMWNAQNKSNEISRQCAKRSHYRVSHIFFYFDWLECYSFFFLFAFHVSVFFFYSCTRVCLSASLRFFFFSFVLVACSFFTYNRPSLFLFAGFVYSFFFHIRNNEIHAIILWSLPKPKALIAHSTSDCWTVRTNVSTLRKLKTLFYFYCSFDVNQIGD